MLCINHVHNISLRILGYENEFDTQERYPTKKGTVSDRNICVPIEQLKIEINNRFIALEIS